MTYYSSRPLVDLRASSMPAGSTAKLWAQTLLVLPASLSINKLSSQSVRYQSNIAVSPFTGPGTPSPPFILLLKDDHQNGFSTLSSHSFSRPVWLACRVLALTHGDLCMVSHFTAGTLTHIQASQKKWGSHAEDDAEREGMQKKFFLKETMKRGRWRICVSKIDVGMRIMTGV